MPRPAVPGRTHLCSSTPSSAIQSLTSRFLTLQLPTATAHYALSHPCLSPCLSTTPGPHASAPAAPPAFYNFAEIKFTHRTICLFQGYMSMNLGAFTDLHKHRHIHLEYFHHLERKPRTFHAQLPVPPCLHPLSLTPGNHVPSFCLYRFAHSRHLTQTGAHNMCSSVSGFLCLASCFQSSSTSQGVSALPFLFNGQIIFHCVGLLMLSLQVTSYAFRPRGLQLHKVPLSVGFPRQEYCIGLPFPSSGDPSDPGTEPASSALRADSLLLSCQGKPGMDTVHCLPIIHWWISGLFPLLAIVNNDAMNIIHVSLQTQVFTSLDYSVQFSHV